MWSLECKHQMLTDNARRTTHCNRPKNASFDVKIDVILGVFLGGPPHRNGPQTYDFLWPKL